MVLEGTVICVDNSDFMRNGDVAPTRMQAQADAVNLLAGAKTQSNPESCVGVLSMAGKVPKMLVTPTPDLGKVLNSMHGLEMDGAVHFSTGVQVAMLALKHRQNKSQRQRVVVFAGSPVAEDEETLVRLGKKLKKNNVAVDVVAFANIEENEAKLQAFVNAVNSNSNSNLVTVPPGALVLSDVLIGTPVFTGDGEGGSGFAASAAFGAAAAARQVGANDGFEFGVDPSIDPELALALRVSMQDERVRQEAAARAAADAAAAGGDAPAAAAGAAATPAAAAGGDALMMDDDALLQQALAMSVDAPAPAAAPAAGAGAGGVNYDDDPELALALQMSVAEAEEAAAKASHEGEGGGAQ